MGLASPCIHSSVSGMEWGDGYKTTFRYSTGRKPSCGVGWPFCPRSRISALLRHRSSKRPVLLVRTHSLTWMISVTRLLVFRGVISAQTQSGKCSAQRGQRCKYWCRPRSRKVGRVGAWFIRAAARNRYKRRPPKRRPCRRRGRGARRFRRWRPS